MKQAEIDRRLKELAAEREHLIDLRRYRSERDEYKRRISQREGKRLTAIKNARQRTDPKGTATLLIELAYRLRNDSKLRYEERKYLADAILGIVKNPKNAAGVFGLTPPANRPPSREIEMRNLAMVLRVEELSEAQPIHPNRTGVSAVELTANEFGVATDVVEYALKNAWGKKVR